jgi:predicted Fe-Mo cluster-binding NifX family protein
MREQLAMPVWEGRVSPVFDTAARLVVVQLENNREVSRREVAVTEPTLVERVRCLTMNKVDALVCGAISNELERMCRAAGIEVIAWVAGPLETVLAAYLRSELPNERFSLPGCPCPCKHGRRRRS